MLQFACVAYNLILHLNGKRSSLKKKPGPTWRCLFEALDRGKMIAKNEAFKKVWEKV